MRRMPSLRRIATLPVSTAFRQIQNIVRTKLLTFQRVDLTKELIKNDVKKHPQFPLVLFRSWIHASKETADRICAHEFDMLGSGVKKLGKHINWQNPFPENRDPKMAWELSRFQFLPTLARAYEIQRAQSASARPSEHPRLGGVQAKAKLIHNDTKYALEAKELIADWILKNPLGHGVNWEITMEVAIRSCNFALAWYFLCGSAPWKSEQWKNTFLTSMVEHGKWIYRNLEYGPGFNSNHFLADITGLLFLGILFPQFKEARKWRKKALVELEREMQKQVYEDGVDFEASIPYHRLACELFGYSALIGKENGVIFSADFLKRLEKMFEFMWYYTKPNGLAPQIGDNDDGRLFIFEDFYSWERRDHNNLMKLARILFPKNVKFNSGDIKKTSRGFNIGGIYIMRKNDFYCIVDAGPNGQNGNAGHAHNDTLSFELSVGGEDFIIDPGTYVYTGDPIARNHFRSTAMHNTVMIDGEEMNRFRKDTVFRMHNDAISRINRWDLDEMADFLDAQHSGYERLKSPVTHRRTFQFDKKRLELTVIDHFVGNGTHELQWNFHFDVGVTIEKAGAKIIAQKNGQILEMMLPFELMQYVSIHDGEVSPQYGVKENAKVLTIRYTIDSSEKRPFTFLFKAV